MGLQDTLFGKKEYKPIAISKPYQKSLDTTAGASLDRYRQKKGGILDKYTAMSDRVMPKAEAATDAGQLDLSAASDKLKSFDPVGTYERLRTGNLGALTGLTDTLSGVGRKQEASLAARLGMAGRPTSSARDLLRSSSLAASFAPVAGTIFSGLGTDTGILGRQLLGQSAELRALAKSRPDLYAQLMQLGLAPLLAEQVGLEGETSALNALANAVRQNYAGMEEKKKMGVFDYMTEGSAAISDTVGNLADAYMSAQTGGLLGGGGGGGAYNGAGGGFSPNSVPQSVIDNRRRWASNPGLSTEDRAWLEKAQWQ